MPQAALNEHDRQTVNHCRRRKRSQCAGIIFLFILLGALLCSFLTVIIWMKDSKYQPRTHLVLIGHHDYTTNDNIQQAIQELGILGTFMTQDVNVIQQKIMLLPWIKQVKVRKKWPDELKIYLVEYVPVACWNDFRKVDVNGISFSEPEEWVTKEILPMLYGPEGSENDVLHGYHIMSNILSSSKYTLKIVAMSARHAWQLTLNNNIRLELGRNDPTSRLQRFIELDPLLQQQGKAESKHIMYIDLRYESGASISWSPLFIN